MVTAGPAAGNSWNDACERCAIGSHPSNDLVIADDTVSRFHCELAIVGGAVRVRDLGSRNGTHIGDIAITDATIGAGTVLALGDTDLRIDVDGEEVEVLGSACTQFGALIGESAAMREVFAALERIAASDATVLVEGETGTGKELTAEAIHDASSRAAGPFVVVDCSAIPPSLLESEMFGHEAGAFTGAVARHVGAFERASGGTLFLDEIGELPIALQPKFLRALESREIRRIGSTANIRCDLRVIAATNRDLRSEVNQGTFRADLYYRLAVIKLRLPPLRERASDISLLVKHLLGVLRASPSTIAELTSPDYLEALATAPWPGNVRELRNHLEQCAVFGDRRLPSPAASPSAQPDARLPYELARRHALDAFERVYLSSLLERCADNVSAAARDAGVSRAHLYRMLGRHGLR
ncbi:MAG: sigma 54-dependent Fis family transcriptional regulator [Kofleriaceae bacterium]|nr:sigma 54-dependent Fis family transcriptional regulator [Kofleriaceae bacterium]